MKRPNHMMLDCVMKATMMSLNAFIATLVKERCIRWTADANLLKYFQRFWLFLIKFEYAPEKEATESLSSTTQQIII